MKYGVIVTFNPILDRLVEIIRALNDISVNVIVVDNGSSNRDCYSSRYFEDLKFNLILNKTNLGIAEAQNIGIEVALSEGAEVICLFDQDSVVPDKYHMLLELTGSENYIFCPLAINDEDKEPFPSFIVNRLGLPTSVYPNITNESRLSVDLAISSGLSIPASVFKEVGLMKSELFIDYVDFEWMFRAKFHGVKAFCLTDVHMYHSVGLGSRKYKGFGIIHNPFRNYYKQRNPFYLLSYRYVPKLYSVKMICSSTFQSIVNIVLEKNQRAKYAESFIRGFIDGMVFLFSSKEKK